MKNLYCCLAVFLLIGLTLPLRAMDKRLVEVPISEAPAYAKYALVVGVTDYDVCPTLHVCGNDAKEFADLLKTKFGFTDVVLMTDGPGTAGVLRPTQRNLKRALETLYGGILPDKSEVVIFFSGHGVRAHDLGGNDADWLVPNDGDPQDVPGTCINYDTIKQRLDTLRPARVLLVTDACRALLTGKAAGEGSGFGKGLTRGTMGPEVAELLSCQPTEVSREGMPADFNESVFTHFLLKGLNGDPDAVDTGGLVTFDSLKEYVQGSVHDYVASHFGNAAQLPDGRATLGRMVLARGAAVPQPIAPNVVVPVAAPQLTPQQANALMLNLWTDPDGKQNDAKLSSLHVPDFQKALEAGANIDAEDNSGNTALILASGLGQINMVRFLLDKGADINLKTKVGSNTALSLAVTSGANDVAHFLLDKGANVNSKGVDGASALWIAAYFGRIDTIDLLLDKGADINLKDDNGMTPIMVAAYAGHIDAVSLLLNRGANIDLKDHAERTALRIADKYGHHDIAVLLKAANAKKH